MRVRGGTPIAVTYELTTYTREEEDQSLGGLALARWAGGEIGLGVGLKKKGWGCGTRGRAGPFRLAALSSSFCFPEN
jgi:hypothetical protein